MFRFVHLLSLVVLLATLESSCHRRRSIPIAAPAMPAPQQPAPEPAPPPSTSPSATSPSTPTPAQTPSSQQPKDEPRYQSNRPAPPPEPQPAPPVQQPPRRQPQRPANSPSPEAPAQPGAPPRLGDVLTPEQERQFNAAIDQNLARAQANLASIANRQLTKDQQGMVAQIQGFISQAQTTRRHNLAAARSLAERADVLSKDLVKDVR